MSRETPGTNARKQAIRKAVQRKDFERAKDYANGFPLEDSPKSILMHWIPLWKALHEDRAKVRPRSLLQPWVRLYADRAEKILVDALEQRDAAFFRELANSLTDESWKRENWPTPEEAGLQVYASIISIMEEMFEQGLESMPQKELLKRVKGNRRTILRVAESLGLKLTKGNKSVS